MTAARRIVFWTGLTLYVAATLVWVLYVPYRPGRVFEAIPADAAFVSVHENLAGQWDTITSNRLLAHWMAAAGLKLDDPDAPASAAAIRSWLERLASRETVLAYLPALGYKQKPALVMATWIGGRSQRLRWQLQWFRLRDLQALPVHGGQTIWVLRNPVDKGNLRVSFALSDGMALACLSEDPAGVRWLLETAERFPWRASLATARQPGRASKLLDGTRNAQWGWLNGKPAAGGSGDSALIAYAINTSNPNELQARLVRDRPLPADAGPIDPAGLDEMRAVLGHSADIVACLPLSWLDPLVLRDNPAPWAEAVRDLTGSRTAAPTSLAFIALLDRGHSGRVRGPFGKTLASLIKGLRTPALAAGWTAPNPQARKTGLQSALATLNTTYGFALAAQEVEGTAGDLTLIESRGKDLYGKFEPEERIAGAASEGWFVMASHAGVLKRLLAERSSGGGGVPDWEPLCRNPGTAAFLWADMRAADKTFKEALAATTLAMLGQNQDKEGDAMKTIDTLRKWSEALGSIETLTVRAWSTPSTTSADVRLTSRPESAP